LFSFSLRTIQEITEILCMKLAGNKENVLQECKGRAENDFRPVV
jgi:hypothetical protein